MSLVRHLSARVRALIGEDPAAKRFLVAVSGGRDSSVLLDAMTRAFPDARLVVAHFNHALRGEASLADEAHAAALASARGLEFVSATGTGTRSDEASLRTERRAFLEREKVARGCDFIVTAHHEEDQVETFLLRTLRGAGLDGLGAMAPRSGHWLRPFLDVRREAIARHAAEHAVTFRNDESNASDRYLRNRIRRAVLPELAALGEGDVLGRMSRTLEELRWASRELSQLAEERYRAIVTETPYWTRLDGAAFLAMAPPWQARILRHALRGLDVEPPSRVATGRVLAALAGGKRAVEARGVKVTASCGQIFLQSKPQRDRLALGVRLDVRDGVAESPELGLVVAAMPGSGPVTWRFLRPGDRLGKKKLKERLLAAGIPFPERALLPVLAVPGEGVVLWHLGQPPGIAHLVKSAFPFSFLPRSPGTLR